MEVATLILATLVLGVTGFSQPRINFQGFGGFKGGLPRPGFFKFPRPQDCIVDYSKWTPCDANCGSGQQQRWGSIHIPATNGGQPCSALEQTRRCDSGIPCTPPPVDCVVDYTRWTPCDANCGSGQQQRWGTIRQSAAYGGLPCGPLEQTRSCDSRIPCTRPLDCQADYTPWSRCDANCGQGRQQRWGTIRQQPAYGGRQCEPLEQTRTCDSGIPCTPPPVDCVIDFSPWSLCDANCGQGRQQRWGTIRQRAAYGGRTCAPLEQTRFCDSGISCTPPPVDCLADYSPWSLCGANCGQGRQQRWGTIRRHAAYGGRQCEPLEQTRTCDSGIPCTPPPVDCVVDFKPWSLCDANCGQGRQQRWGTIRQREAYGGRACEPLEQTRFCDSGISCTPAPVDCSVDYTPWSLCDANCGQGRQQRWGTIRRPASNGGLPCRPLEQTRKCSTGIPCDRNFGFKRYN